jgi:hypothetical protein
VARGRIIRFSAQIGHKFLRRGAGRAGLHQGKRQRLVQPDSVSKKSSARTRAQADSTFQNIPPAGVRE